MDFKSLIPILIEILKGVAEKTENEIDDAAIKLAIAILKHYGLVE